MGSLESQSVDVLAPLEGVGTMVDEWEMEHLSTHQKTFSGSPKSSRFGAQVHKGQAWQDDHNEAGNRWWTRTWGTARRTTDMVVMWHVALSGDCWGVSWTIVSMKVQGSESSVQVSSVSEHESLNRVLVQGFAGPNPELWVRFRFESSSWDSRTWPWPVYFLLVKNPLFELFCLFGGCHFSSCLPWTAALDYENHYQKRHPIMSGSSLEARWGNGELPENEICPGDYVTGHWPVTHYNTVNNTYTPESWGFWSSLKLCLIPKFQWKNQWYQKQYSY